jgi:hypothetical protein
MSAVVDVSAELSIVQTMFVRAAMPGGTIFSCALKS